jgi:hypothetical protein
MDGMSHQYVQITASSCNALCTAKGIGLGGIHPARASLSEPKENQVCERKRLLSLANFNMQQSATGG